MKQVQPVWFVIVTYKPDVAVLTTLRKSLEGKPVIEIDNTRNNLGYGGGANEGIRKALAQGAEWVVILNQDIVLSNIAVEKLSIQLSTLPPCIAGPWVGALDKKRWTTILLKTGSPIRACPRPDRGSGMTVDYVSGACMAIHKDVIKTVGYFYEPYFMYYEDADFSVRATQYDFPLHHIHIKGIIHREHPVWKKGSRRHEWFLARNHILFVLRLAPWEIKLRELIRLPKTILGYFQKL